METTPGSGGGGGQRTALWRNRRRTSAASASTLWLTLPSHPHRKQDANTFRVWRFTRRFSHNGAEFQPRTRMDFLSCLFVYFFYHRWLFFFSPGFEHSSCVYKMNTCLLVLKNTVEKNKLLNYSCFSTYMKKCTYLLTVCVRLQVTPDVQDDPSRKTAVELRLRRKRFVRECPDAFFRS